MQWVFDVRIDCLSRRVENDKKMTFRGVEKRKIRSISQISKKTRPAPFSKNSFLALFLVKPNFVSETFVENSFLALFPLKPNFPHELVIPTQSGPHFPKIPLKPNFVSETFSKNSFLAKIPLKPNFINETFGKNSLLVQIHHHRKDKLLLTAYTSHR
jgi:hypothetical protein